MFSQARLTLVALVLTAVGSAGFFGWQYLAGLNARLENAAVEKALLVEQVNGLGAQAHDFGVSLVSQDVFIKELSEQLATAREARARIEHEINEKDLPGRFDEWVAGDPAGLDAWLSDSAGWMFRRLDAASDYTQADAGAVPGSGNARAAAASGD